MKALFFFRYKKWDIDQTMFGIIIIIILIYLRHVVVGDAFGFEIAHESQNIILLFFGGTTGICAWKCM